MALRVGSPLIEGALLGVAYVFAGIVAWQAVEGNVELSAGEQYIRLLTAVLLLIGAHGFSYVRRNQEHRLGESAGTIQDVTTDVTMSVCTGSLHIISNLSNASSRLERSR